MYKLYIYQDHGLRLMDMRHEEEVRALHVPMVSYVNTS